MTFGAGENPGPPLDNRITNFTYVNSGCPEDGQYTIRNKTYNCHLSTWHNIHDHTGDPNGYFMLVNASFQPSVFFLTSVDNLCGNTTYEFAAWILNICNLPRSIKPNLTFTLENPDGSVLKSFDTGDIPVTDAPEWKKFGLYFTTPPNVSKIVLRIRNNAPGGLGNDLALDDITFRPCGPKISASFIGETESFKEFCEDNQTNLSIAAQLSKGYNKPVYQWQLSKDVGITWADLAGANSLTYTKLPTGSGTYWYRLAVAESGNIGLSTCRIVSNYLPVTVHPKPKIQLLTNAPLCLGSTLEIKAVVTNFSQPAWQTIWTYPSGSPANFTTDSSFDASSATVSISNHIKSTAQSEGNYSIRVRDSYGCTGSNATSVVIWSRPIANFSLPTITCQSRNLVFTNNAGGKSPLVSSAWNFGDGKTSNAMKPDHIYDSSGQYTTSLKVTDSNGCTSDSVTKLVSIHPLPQVNFIMPGICLLDPYASFQDSSTIRDGSGSAFTYQWSFGDPGPENFSTLKDPRHRYPSIGHYNLHLSVTSKDGCGSEALKVFTVNGTQPRAAFGIQNPDSLCSRDSAMIVNHSTVDFGSIVKLEVWWDNTNGAAAFTLDQAPAPGKFFNHDYSAQMDSAEKTFTIRYIAYSGINCLNETSQPIKIHRSPKIEFNPIGAVCQEVPAFLLKNAHETTGALGKGFYSGNGIFSDSLFDPLKAGPGSQNISYAFVTQAGCSATSEQLVQVYSQPIVNAGPPETIIKGSYIFLHGSASGNSLQYDWSPGASLDNHQILSPKASPLSDVTYTLQVRSAEGCTNVSTVNIKVLKELYIPNAFSPNGDGLNDVWRLPNLDAYPNVDAWVYNRWGQAVFHSKGPLISWDGKFNGEMVPPGTYIYLIDLKRGLPAYKGTLTLIR
ncbi:MAG: hypothetical protein NVS9B7_01200 [Flavisolibacter sp.]